MRLNARDRHPVARKRPWTPKVVATILLTIFEAVCRLIARGGENQRSKEWPLEVRRPQFLELCCLACDFGLVYVVFRM